MATFLRTDALSVKTGLCPICLKVVVNKKRKIISLDLQCSPEQWDVKARRVRKSVPGHQDINLCIANAESKATAIFTEHRLSGQHLTADSFKELFLEENSRLDFISYMQKQIEARLHRGDTNENTYKQEIASLNGLKKWRKQILFSELTVELLKEFDHWLHQELKAFAKKQKRELKSSGLNTRGKYRKHIKIYVRIAQRQGIRFKNPFDSGELKVVRVPGHRKALSQPEVRKLYALYTSGELSLTQYYALKPFLFCCFTGLRISDMKRLQSNMVVDGYLVFAEKKGRRYGKSQVLPLNKQAKELIRGRTGLLFQPLAEAEINIQLKILAAKAGINMPDISFHVSRHTFATMFLEAGGKVEVLQRLLGHTRLETTMIYVHIVEQRKLEQVELMDTILAPLPGLDLSFAQGSPVA